MDVQVQSSFTLFGCTAEPYELQLTIFDRFACNFHVAVLYAFSPPTPSTTTLVAGLSKALSHFPTLTAQLSHDDRRFLMGGSGGGGGGGALVVEAEVASSLSEHLPLEPSPELLRLHPPTQDAAHLLQVQLNRFRCGGLVVGLSAHHKVADGASMGAFLAAWGQAVRGVNVDPLPLYDRSWMRPRSPPRCEIQHWGLDFAPVAPPNGNGEFTASDKRRGFVDPSRISNILLHYPSDYITGTLKPATKSKYSTFETLLAHLWRKITIARGLAAGQETAVRITVNGRPRMRPPIPARYFGNVVLNAYPKAKTEQLTVGGGLETAAEIVRAAIGRVDASYVQSMVDFGAAHAEEELVPAYEAEGNVLSPELDAESWLGLRFEELEFGGGEGGNGGRVCGFLPTWVPLEGLVIFLPAVGAGGGVDVVVTLLEEDAKVLKKISHTLD